MTITDRAITSAPARLAAAVAAVVFCSGCGQTSKLNSNDKKAFEQANPEVKQTWERALAAEKANDYLNAQNLLDTLGQTQLNDAQRQALDKEREAFNQRVWQAAEKNDAAAVKTVQASQRSRARLPSAPAQ